MEGVEQKEKKKSDIEPSNGRRNKRNQASELSEAHHEHGKPLLSRDFGKNTGGKCISHEDTPTENVDLLSPGQIYGSSQLSIWDGSSFEGNVVEEAASNKKHLFLRVRDTAPGLLYIADIQAQDPCANLGIDAQNKSGTGTDSLEELTALEQKSIGGSATASGGVVEENIIKKGEKKKRNDGNDFGHIPNPFSLGSVSLQTAAAELGKGDAGFCSSGGVQDGSPGLSAPETVENKEKIQETPHPASQFPHKNGALRLRELRQGAQDAEIEGGLMCESPS